MMLKLLTVLAIFSTSLVVSTEAIFLQDLRRRIMCRMAKRKLQRMSGKDCSDCEKEEDDDGERWGTVCEAVGYAAVFGDDGAAVTFKNDDGQFLSFVWEEPGFFGVYGKAKECVAYEGENVDKLCDCEIKNFLAKPIIPLPLSYEVSNCVVLGL